MSTGIVAGAVLGGACDRDRDPGPSGSGAWAFTDDLGRRISLPRRPRRVVAYVSGAAALWDFGLRPVGIYGPSQTASGRPNLLAGHVDLSAVQSVGSDYTEFELEKLAALKPDLVIASLNGRSAADRWIIKDTVARRIEQICPVYSIQEALRPLPAVIGAYQTLAQRLGVDVHTAAISHARRSFQQAAAALRRAVADRPGLRAEFVYGDADAFYVASPKFYSTVMYYRQLGLTVARQDDRSSQFLRQLSWEQAGRYRADLILTDIRSFSLSRRQMASRFPTFRELPAVRAGQVGGWNGEPRFSYQQAVGEITALTAAVRHARRLG